MTILLLMLAVVYGWRADFTRLAPDVRQLYEYQIDIAYEDGQLVLSGQPDVEGGSTAWFYFDSIAADPSSVLEFGLRVGRTPVRLRVFFIQSDHRLYRCAEAVVEPADNWQVISFPIKDTKPFFSANFPFALTPGATPDLFVFIDNLSPGEFEVRFDRIECRKPERAEEKI